MKRPSRRPFLAHEQQRDLRRQQHDRDRRMRPAVSGASAVMRLPNGVLPIWSWFCRNETKAVGGRLPDGSPRGLAAAIGRRLALIDEAAGQRAAEMRDRLARRNRRNSRCLAGHEDMQRVVQIVVPLRGVADRPSLPRGAGGAPRSRRFRAPDASARSVRSAGAPSAPSSVRMSGVAVVDDRVHRVEPQPVEMILLQPVERVLDHEVAHRPARGAVVIDRRAPWRLVPLGEEMRRDRRAGNSPRGRNGCRRRRAGSRGRARGRPRPAPSDPRAGHRRAAGAKNCTPS